jgi:hypothetical protein
VAASVPAPAGLAPGLAWFDLDQPAAVFRWIQQRLAGRA